MEQNKNTTYLPHIYGLPVFEQDIKAINRERTVFSTSVAATNGHLNGKMGKWKKRCKQQPSHFILYTKINLKQCLEQQVTAKALKCLEIHTRKSLQPLSIQMCLKYKNQKRKLYIHVIFSKINEQLTYLTYTKNTFKKELE